MKSRTSSILENWMSFRLRLFLEGILIGLVAGCAIVIYRIALEKAELARNHIYFLFTIKPWWSVLIWFFTLFLLAYLLGLIAKKDPMIGGSGIPQVKGQLSSKLKVNWLHVIAGKFVGGVLAIGAGLSLGREGPSVQIGAAIGQGIGRLLGRFKMENKYLLTCGASAGLAAAFNAPLAGVIFALEEMHKNFSPIVLSSAMAASLTADFVSQHFLGQMPVFTFQSLPILPLNYYVYLIVLGLILGVLGVYFNRSLIKTLDLFAKFRIPVEYKAVLPLITAGVLGFVLPETLGGGHHLINSLGTQKMVLTSLFLLVVVKFYFTMLSYGSGAPGGIFLPLLVIGALIGDIFGNIAASFLQIEPQYINNFIVLSMAAYFTSVVKAPITAAILITEMIGSFSHLLAVATVSITAYLFTELVNSKPIYDVLLDRLLVTGVSPEAGGEYQNKVIIEVAVCLGSKLDQKRIKDIQWPKDCLLVGIMRGEKEIIPKGNTIIQVGDFLVVLTNENNEAMARESLLALACESVN